MQHQIVAMKQRLGSGWTQLQLMHAQMLCASYIICASCLLIRMCWCMQGICAKRSGCKPCCSIQCTCHLNPVASLTTSQVRYGIVTCTVLKLAKQRQLNPATQLRLISWTLTFQRRSAQFLYTYLY